MKTTIAAIFLGTFLLGTVYAGEKHCRNDLGTCKCNSNYSTTLHSTGRYRVDLSKGAIWINFNPQDSGYYQIKIYKKSLAMSLTQCGKAGYVHSIWKKDDCSNSFIAELSNKQTYRLYLNRAKRSDTSMIVEISRINKGCSRVKRVSSDYSKTSRLYLDRSLSIIKRPSSNSYSKPSYKYNNRNGCYYRSSGNRHHSSNSGKRKSSTKSGIGFSISF